MDQDLNDDMNKLVRYSIVCVDRENETVLQEGRETLVKERMDSSGFVAWKILEFSAKMARGDVRLPDEWHGSKRPEDVVICKKNDRYYLQGFKNGDITKYLRVAYHVVDRYPVERFRYEEKQIDVLKSIGKAICGNCGDFKSPCDADPCPEPKKDDCCSDKSEGKAGSITINPGERLSIEVEGKNY